MSLFSKSNALKSELGVGLVEYALLVALLAVIGIASMRTLGEEVRDTTLKAAAAIQLYEDPDDWESE